GKAGACVLLYDGGSEQPQDAWRRVELSHQHGGGHPAGPHRSPGVYGSARSPPNTGSTVGDSPHPPDRAATRGLRERSGSRRRAGRSDGSIWPAVPPPRPAWTVNAPPEVRVGQRSTGQRMVSRVPTRSGCSATSRSCTTAPSRARPSASAVGSVQPSISARITSAGFVVETPSPGPTEDWPAIGA